jgi:hypothetical protein
VGENDRAAGIPRPYPRLELTMGVVAQITVLTLLPAWVIWILSAAGPPWLWVAVAVCAALLPASRVPCGRGRTAESAGRAVASWETRSPGRW